uniref:Sulfurtransferase complex subunit TusD n=1 Tax=Candidatus Aschnera chinzeii TaxID=1485666 RepID=A0AAT9G4M2_9ENTR|nr:MAG: sulfurtransferase complex subunit TusD [Candidatus Aschnera chinzeii]
MSIINVDQRLLYCIVVSGPVYGTQNACIAWKFADALITEGHILNSVFFHQDGVSNANAMIFPINDEFNLLAAWKNLKKKAKCQLNVCISSALRRGIINDDEAKSSKIFFATADSDFTFIGLVGLTKAMLICDRTVQF